MIRGWNRVLLAVLVVCTAGCLSTSEPPTYTVAEPDQGDGIVVAEVVTEEPPNGTVIQYADSGIGENFYVNRAVSDLVSGNATSARVGVPEHRVESVKDHLADYEGYTPTDPSDPPPGYYVRYDGIQNRLPDSRVSHVGPDRQPRPAPTSYRPSL